MMQCIIFRLSWEINGEFRVITTCARHLNEQKRETWHCGRHSVSTYRQCMFTCDSVVYCSILLPASTPLLNQDEVQIVERGAMSVMLSISVI